MPHTFSSLFYGAVPSLPEPTTAQLTALPQVQVATVGTLLTDFATLLTDVGAGVEVTAGHHFCPHALAQLNGRLSRSLSFEPKRPLQKSYPHIQGLYLLLRSTGLGLIEGKGKQRWLRLDPTVLAAWERLTPTEQYFTLLEAWLIWGNDEILGEPLNLCRRFYDYLGRCLRLWPYLTPVGLPVHNAADQQRLAHCLGLPNLALLELFGWVRVQTDASKPGWQVQHIDPLPLGETLLRLLGQWAAQTLDRLDRPSGDRLTPAATPDGGAQVGMFGEWRSLLQPYFPQWQQTLELPQPEFRDGVYRFKVSLCNIWRRIEIPASATLDELSSSILNSVDFDEHQLYCFSFKNRFGWTVRINHPFLQEGPFTHRYRIGELPLCRGARLSYLFDFGEQWEFDITLERIAAPDPTLTQPRLVECHGEPPEQYSPWDETEVSWDSLGA